jgi:hypothetical protein
MKKGKQSVMNNSRSAILKSRRQLKLIFYHFFRFNLSTIARIQIKIYRDIIKKLYQEVYIFYDYYREVIVVLSIYLPV